MMKSRGSAAAWEELRRENEGTSTQTTRFQQL